MSDKTFNKFRYQNNTWMAINVHTSHWTQVTKLTKASVIRVELGVFWGENPQISEGLHNLTRRPVSLCCWTDFFFFLRWKTLYLWSLHDDDKDATRNFICFILKRKLLSLKMEVDRQSDIFIVSTCYGIKYSKVKYFNWNNTWNWTPGCV